MTKLDVVAHNKYVRERIEFYNEKWGTKQAEQASLADADGITLDDTRRQATLAEAD
jgi:hypothetical protein